MSRNFMRWWYQRADGEFVFQHYRVADPDSPRGKRYGYRMPVWTRDGKVKRWVYQKPADADGLVWQLPLVLANPAESLTLTEGERCAAAALRLGILATSHHGGAGKFNEQMAESLARHRGEFLLVADNDGPGAVDVCRRYDLLRGVGIPAKRLRVREVVPSHQGADLRDHLDAGYSLADLKPGGVGRLREVAASVEPSGFTRAGYMTDEERDEIRNWRSRVKVVPRSAS